MPEITAIVADMCATISEWSRPIMEAATGYRVELITDHAWSVDAAEQAALDVHRTMTDALRLIVVDAIGKGLA